MYLCYLRPPNRRPVWNGPYFGPVDWQGILPRLWCPDCGSEVFERDTLRCPRCEKEVKSNDLQKRSKSL